MNTSLSISEKSAKDLASTVSITPARKGKELEIGNGFSALTFREKDFLGAMDPLVMVDHYQMTEPTFGAHPHAGLSAVSVLFEDSEGKFHNRDSLGNDFDLMPGDLYWLKAGSGVVHDESPRPGAKIHGLQVFVNLPALSKKSQPASLRVKAKDVPRHEQNGSRVRIVLGESNGIAGQQSPALPMTILDGHIDPRSVFSHQINEDENAWLYAVKGELEVTINKQKVKLIEGQSIAISSSVAASLNPLWLLNTGNKTAHFVLFAAKPIGEAFVQKGPFVMSTAEEIAEVEANFAAGKLGRLA